MREGAKVSVIEGATTCGRCGQWFDLEELIFEKGECLCDKCFEK